jgi:hypothetical protein
MDGALLVLAVSATSVFYGIALFFSVLFLWQLVAALMGFAGSESEAEVDTDVGGDADFEAEAPEDFDLEAEGGLETGEAGVGAGETAASFKILSLRSIIAFGMLFGWAGALYLREGRPLSQALLYAILWATAGGLLVSLGFYFMRRMQESGTPRIATCVGRPGTVYMDIPAGGSGQIRTLVGGVASTVAARSKSGEHLPQGTPVRVLRVLDAHCVEVEKTGE